MRRPLETPNGRAMFELALEGDFSSVIKGKSIRFFEAFNALKGQGCYRALRETDFSEFKAARATQERNAPRAIPM